jgi:hypothetical protein
MDEVLRAQNQVMICLLARSVFGIEGIVSVILRAKKIQNPETYLRIYNMLDGTVTAVDAAKIVGISQPGMSYIFRQWEKEGIVYNVGSIERPLYHRLLQVPEDVIKKSAKSGIRKGKSQTDEDTDQK